MGDRYSIRWLWGYDREGVRITEPEAVGFDECESCGGLHPCRTVRLVDFQLTFVAGRLPREMAGKAWSEFYPD